MSADLTIVDPTVVKGEIVEYFGHVLEDARVLSIEITSDAMYEEAVKLGVTIKEKTKWLKGRRVVVYEPLKAAAETVRLEYDNPLKLAEQMERALSAAGITWKQKKKAEEERLRLEKEAEARRIREEAAKKEREAAAERDRIIKEREAREQKERDEREAEEKRKKDAELKAKAEADAKAKAEQDERDRQIKQEEDRRLENAQKASDVGLADRSEQILDKQKPVAPLPAPLPSAADLAAKAEEKRKADEAAAMEEARKIAQKDAEEKKRQEEAEHLRKLDEEAAKSKAAAAEAEAVASKQVTVERPDKRMNTSVRWRYDVPNVEAFKKLCLAVAEGRAPVEYAGFNPDKPQEFRGTAALQNDVTRQKELFQGDGIGIRTWPEEIGSFKAGA